MDGHAHDKHAHDHAEHAHTNGIRACCLTSDEPLSWDAVSAWLARLRKGAGQDLLRVKGILNLIGENAPVAIMASITCFIRPCSSKAGRTPISAPASSSSHAESSLRTCTRALSSTSAPRVSDSAFFR